MLSNLSWDEVYTLNYRSGSSVLTKVFTFPGDIHAATKEGKRHCDFMGFAFIYVKHFISKFSLEEENKLAGIQRERPGV